MSMETNPGTGVADGWMVTNIGTERWRWSAYGPRGGEAGEADTHDEAERVAKAAYERLRHPWPRPPEVSA